MEITYTLTADDYYDALKVYRSRRLFSRWFWRLMWLATALALAAPLLALAFGNHYTYLQYRPLGFAGMLWAVLIVFSGPRATARKYAKGIPGAGQPRTMTTTDEGVHVHSNQNESRWVWTSMVDWHDGKRVFTVFMSPISFFPVPKRAMTDAQQQEFRSLLQQHVKGS